MKEYSKKIELSHLRLSKKDLEDLVDISTEEFTKKSRKIITIRAEIGNATIEEDSISKFFSHKEIPARLFNLTVSISEFSKDKYDSLKRIYMSFRDYYNSVRLSGVSETWINGKTQQIENFLRNKRSKIWFLFSGKFTFLAVMLSVLLYFLINKSKSVNIYVFAYNVISFSLFVYLITSGLVNIFPKKIYPQFLLTTTEDRDRENLNVIIGIIMLIFTIAGFVIGVLSYLKMK